MITNRLQKIDSIQSQTSRMTCVFCFASFFPDAKGLSNPSEVEGLREKVYASLESYTKQKYPDQPGR